MTGRDPCLWVVIPAAGIGSRFGDGTPKQYHQLAGKAVIEWALQPFLERSDIAGIVVAVADEDNRWLTDQKVMIAAGGSERSESVLNALLALREKADDLDWVLVHDAVRPCLRQQDIDKLVTEVATDENGGLLALPVRDTMKRQKADVTLAAVEKTVQRENLWHALTPQYFPADRLKTALQSAKQGDLLITDESSAMEMAGFSPRLVQGHEDNIKITRPDDLRLASLYLQASKQA